MNIFIKLFLGILIIVYVIQTFKYVQKINDSQQFGKSQKRINTILVWTFPFVWYWFIKSLIKPTEVMTKGKRKIDKSNFTESGKGMYPVD